MLHTIVDALNKRSDLAGWTVRHVNSQGVQVYAVPNQTEAQRVVGIEQYRIDVLRQTSAPDGTAAVGSGNATLLPGGEVEAAIEKAVLTAGLVANPVHSLPAPAALPDVPLVDADLYEDASSTARAVMERIQTAASRNPEVQLTAAEYFGEIHTTHLLNSRGIDAEQEATQINIEFVLRSQRGERDVEGFTEMRRRRITDLQIESEIEERTRRTLDQFEAISAPSWQGPVVLRDEVLSTFMAGDSLRGGVLHTLGSAEAKYAKISPWEIGKSFEQCAPCSAITPVERLGKHLSEGKIQLAVNGKMRQDGDLNLMIWNVQDIIMHLSTQVGLAAGDLIYTGTPAGVAAVVAGDKMVGTIAGLGELSITITPARTARAG